MGIVDQPWRVEKASIKCFPSNYHALNVISLDSCISLLCISPINGHLM